MASTNQGVARVLTVNTKGDAIAFLVVVNAVIMLIYDGNDMETTTFILTTKVFDAVILLVAAQSY